MTAEQSVEYLLSHSRLFERSVIRDRDRHGRDFCEMIIKNVNETISEIFEVTGFIDILTIE